MQGTERKEERISAKKTGSYVGTEPHGWRKYSDSDSIGTADGDLLPEDGLPLTKDVLRQPCRQRVAELRRQHTKAQHCSSAGDVARVPEPVPELRSFPSMLTRRAVAQRRLSEDEVCVGADRPAVGAGGAADVDGKALGGLASVSEVHALLQHRKIYGAGCRNDYCIAILLQPSLRQIGGHGLTHCAVPDGVHCLGHVRAKPTAGAVSLGDLHSGRAGRRWGEERGGHCSWRNAHFGVQIACPCCCGCICWSDSNTHARRHARTHIDIHIHARPYARVYVPMSTYMMAKVLPPQPSPLSNSGHLVKPSMHVAKPSKM